MNMTRVSNIESDLQTSVQSVSKMTRKQINEDNAIPTSKYTKLSERFRKSTNQQLLCNMFCGGRKCKYECSGNWSDQQKALPGIFSHWVTEDIIAMARPNTETIHNYNLIHCFHENNIKSIINLQEPGEHANCGNALTTSGFSYDPTLFMENDVYFYNFQWRDYSIVTNEVLLDMVKVMVAIHCHAGLGRTGVLIASYLVFTFRCTPHEAIRYVRLKRPNSIQTRGQILSVLQFSQYVIPIFVTYHHIIQRQVGLTLSQTLQRQRLLLHGYELRHLKYIPKILYVICERLLKLCGRHKVYSRGISQQILINRDIAINFQLDNSESFCKSFFSSNSTAININREERPESNNTIQLSSGIMSPETELTELAELAELAELEELTEQNSFATNESRRSTANLRDRNSKNNVIKRNNDSSCVNQSLVPIIKEPQDRHTLVFKDIEFINTPIHQIGLVGLETPTKSYSHKSKEISKCTIDEYFGPTLSDSLTSILEKTLEYRVLQIDSSQMLYEEDIVECDRHKTRNFNSRSLNEMIMNEEFVENENDIDSNSLDAQCSSGFISVNCGNCTEDEDIEITDRIMIINALLADYKAYNKMFTHALLQYQKELNNKQSSWERLGRETCIEVLCALMWSWIENLIEPILNKNSLCYIVLKAEKPLEALMKLDQNTRFTFEYLIRFIARLKPDEENEEIVLKYLMAILTRQRLKLSNDKLVPEGRDWPEMRKGTAGRLILFTNTIYQLLNSN